MNKPFLKDAVGGGLILWAVGFLLGMILFTFVDIAIMGWIIMPMVVLVAIVLAARMAKKRAASIAYFFSVGVVWLVIPLLLDYVILVRGYDAENYYDLDIMIYYASMLLIPVVVSIIIQGRNGARI